MLPKSTQIGGKGTMRRKKKRVGNTFFKEKNTKEQREYRIKINRINKIIEEIEDNDEYSKFKLYIDTEMEDIGLSIEKYDLTKQARKLEYDDVKEDCLTFVYSLLISDIDRPLKFNPEAFGKLKKTFEIEYLSMFVKFIYDIEVILEKKKYLEDTKEDNYEMEDIHKFFDILELDKHEIPTKQMIEKAYKQKALKYHPDKNINKENTENKDNKEQNDIEFKNLGEAYQALLNRYTKK